MFSWESSLIKWSIFRDHLNINKNLYWKIHDDVIKWRHSPCYWSFVWGIQRSPVDSPHKGQWRWALMFFICSWINSWVNNREAGNLRCHRGHYDVIVMHSNNYANPVYGVATICHQVRWLRWGHPSLFHTATSLLIIPPKTKFRGGILDSPCSSVRLSVRPSVRPSVRGLVSGW